MQKISIDNIDTASLSTVFVTNAAGPVLNKITTVYVTDSSYNNTSVTAVDVTGGYIKIVGTGFVSGCQVLINTVPAAATTFISSTEVRAQVNATTAGTVVDAHGWRLEVMDMDGLRIDKVLIRKQ